MSKNRSIADSRARYVGSPAGLALLLVALLIPCLAQKREAGDYFKKWLEEDVSLIITPEEREIFEKLTTPEEKTAFVDQFWKRRDPSQGTEINEFKEEHYRRIQFANERFACGKPGWMTDRGKIYVKFGPPNGTEARPTGGTYTRPMSEGGGTTYAFPFEIWHYTHIDGVGDNVYIEFVDPSRTNEFHISRSPLEKDALLTVPGTGLTMAEEMGLETRADRIMRDALADQSRAPLRNPSAEEMPFERLSRLASLEKAPPIRFDKLREVVTSDVRYNLIPFQIRVDQLEISPEMSLVPITVELKTGSLQYKREGDLWFAEVDLYGRVINLQGSLISEFDQELRDSAPGAAAPATPTNLLFQKPLFLKPGSYKLELAVQDINSARMGSLEQRIVVPAPVQDQSLLRSSPLLLAMKIDKMDSPDPRFEQFALGDLKVVPNVSGTYSTSQNLWVYYQLYGVQKDSSTGKASLNISYEVFKDGLRRGSFNDPSMRSVRETGSYRVICTGGVPLSAFPPGSYQLRVRVEDKVAGKELTISAPFTLLAAERPRAPQP